MDDSFPFQQTLEAASEFSVIDRQRLQLLSDCADRMARDVEGDFIELGVFRGGSAILLAAAIKFHRGSGLCHLLDSWQGLPDFAEQDQGAVLPPGRFALASEDAVRVRLDQLGLLDVCRTYRGWIADTLPALEGPFAFAHIDLDLYEPTRFALQWLLARMADAGEIIVDDYGSNELRRFPGVEIAVSETLSDSGWVIAEQAGERDQSIRLLRQS